MDKEAQRMNRFIRQIAGRLPETLNGAEMGTPAVVDHGTADGGAHGAPIPRSVAEMMNKLIRDAAEMPGRSFVK